ncbi:MAG: 23S rRNA (adenine(2030)-N(6))-methyltransferase RlmJ [Xanthomonadales bacterium]|jgi:23S rRNA (adenine2030-N6)-methyltransferase|nr:23S rRNA (adenine(2030)-N(6))-methyltransferase RlmJ [Xanthomonadales bacterium]
MNYLHAYHAGNFADVHKHAVLLALLSALKRKPAPLSYVETHAGAGRYDLTGPAAIRTGESNAGVRLVLSRAADDSLLADYRSVVAAMNPEGGANLYPGSPWIAAHMLGSADRLLLCEREATVAEALRGLFARDERVAVHQRDGYEALRALLPPPIRRGLVLIDPPWEDAQESRQLLKQLAAGLARWDTATWAIWYPIKLRADVQVFHRGLKALDARRGILATELCIHPDDSALRLNGSGLAVLNPPLGMERTLAALGQVLHRALAQSRFARSELHVLKPRP